MSKQMLKYIESIPKESWVELQGAVQIPKDKDGSRQPITGTSQQVCGVMGILSGNATGSHHYELCLPMAASACLLKA